MLKIDFDLLSCYRFALATVFNSDFNNFAPITANQAEFLFFTAGRDDATLGFNSEFGRLFNRILLGIVFAVALSSFVLRAF